MTSKAKRPRPASTQAQRSVDRGAGPVKPDKAKPAKAQRVPKLATVDVPITLLKAAFACSSQTKDRLYLKGVRVHQAEKGKVRVVGTDGHRMFVGLFEREEGEKPAPWLEDGVIVPNDLLRPQLAMIEKAQSDLKSMPAGAFCTLGWAKGAPKLELSDRRGSCVFKVSPVDGTFPDYQRIIESAHAPFTGEGRKDFVPIGYSGKYLKAVGEIAAALESSAVNVFADHEKGPTVITFAGAPGAVLYLMPMAAETGFAPETRAILAPAIKGTIAALKAHKTRTEESLKAAKTPAEKAVLSERVAEYDARIKAAVEASASNALPPPEKMAGPTVAFTGVTEAKPIAATSATTGAATGEAPAPTPAPAPEAAPATAQPPGAPTLKAPIAAPKPIKTSIGPVAKNGRNLRGPYAKRRPGVPMTA